MLIYTALDTHHPPLECSTPFMVFSVTYHLDQHKAIASNHIFHLLQTKIKKVA
jgi:hypothetical protein